MDVHVILQAAFRVQLFPAQIAHESIIQIVFLLLMDLQVLFVQKFLTALFAFDFRSRFVLRCMLLDVIFQGRFIVARPIANAADEVRLAGMLGVHVQLKTARAEKSFTAKLAFDVVDLQVSLGVRD